MNRRQLLQVAALAPALSTFAGAGSVALAAPPTARTVRVRRTGWAGVQIEYGDKALFVDPEILFASRPELGVATVPLETSAGWRFVAITHLHRDHFDVEAVRSILKTPDDLVICQDRVAASVASRQLPVASVAMYEPFSAGEYEGDDIALAPVPAQDGYGDPQVSWVIVAGGLKMIHCGDTMWHGDWMKIGRIYGPFDIAFLPINGVRQNADIAPVSTIVKSMTPEQAAQAAVLLQARAVVPIHYGRQPRASYVETENAETLFVAAATAAGIRPIIAQPGSWIEV